MDSPSAMRGPGGPQDSRPPGQRYKAVAALIAAMLLLCLSVRSDSLPPWRQSSFRLNTLPREIFWSWQRVDDLRRLDPQATAIAFLDQTIVIGAGVEVEPRLESFAYPQVEKLISVVRIEVRPGARLDDGVRQATVDLLLESARRPGIAAFQVDFDATRSQRSFYADVLRDLRRRMPAELPLSMTALASWCSYDDWISRLPVDEAVPMFFRMEPDRRRARPDLSIFRIREPLCAHSAGVSTREPWPQEISGKRLYIFADRGWQQDLALLRNRKVQ